MGTELKTAKILVVEDNPSFVDLLKILLFEIGVTSVQVAHDYEEGLQQFIEHHPDLCILDIALGENAPDGIELAEKIRSRDARVAIMFLTSFYNEDIYDQVRHLRPSSFMNKELSKFKLHHAIDLALLSQPACAMAAPAPLTSLVTTPYITDRNLFFKVGDFYKKIVADEIAFFFAKDKLTYARVEARNFPINVQLKTLEEEMAPTFLRVHKSYLVNVNHIDIINPKEAVVQVESENIPIGYNYRKHFFEQVHLLK